MFIFLMLVACLNLCISNNDFTYDELNQDIAFETTTII